MKLAVCICTCGRNEELRACLEAVAAALVAYPPAGAVEVVVADNAPGGAADGVVAALSPAFPCPLTLVREPARGIPHARNAALRAALACGADAAACVDDDDVPCVDWLERLAARWQQTQAEIVFGNARWDQALPLAPWQRELKIFAAPSFDGLNRWGLPAGAGTFNVLIARSLVERLAAKGPVFDPAFAHSGGSDFDFMIRAIRAGATHAVAADSFVTRRWEADRLTFRGVMRRAFRIGNLRAIHDRNHADPRRSRKKQLRIARDLLRHFGVAPSRMGSRARAAAWAFDLARMTGEAYGRWLGGRYRYYGSHRRLGRGRRPA